MYGSVNWHYEGERERMNECVSLSARWEGKKDGCVCVCV